MTTYHKINETSIAVKHHHGGYVVIKEMEGQYYVPVDGDGGIRGYNTPSLKDAVLYAKRFGKIARDVIGNKLLLKEIG